jgi:hypothetical protein
LVLLFPAADRILQAGESRSIGSLCAFKFDETLYCGSVPAYLAEQVIEQDRFPHHTREQLLSRMSFSAYLPQNGFKGERELALRAEFWTFLLRSVRLIQIDPAVGATHQVMINICTAIAALDFIVCRGRGKAGRHEKIVSKKPA